MKRRHRVHPAVALRQVNDHLHRFTNSDFSLRFYEDGICKTTDGYRIQAEDTRDGSRITLFSRDPQRLRGAIDAEGVRRLPNMEHIYVVGALLPDIRRRMTKNNRHGLISSTPGMHIRTDHISKHHWDFRAFAHTHMTLHGGDVTDLYNKAARRSRKKAPKPDHPLRIISLGNTRFSYGLYERSDNKWMFRIFANGDDLTVPASDFTSIDDKLPSSILRRSFSLGQKGGLYDNLCDAFAAVFVDSDARMQKLWRAEPPISFRESPSSYLKRRTNSFMKHNMERHGVIETIADVTLAASASIFTGQIFVAVAAGVTTLFTKVFTKGLTHAVSRGFDHAKETLRIQKNTQAQKLRRQMRKAHHEASDRARAWHHKGLEIFLRHRDPHEAKLRQVLAHTPGNMERLCKKPEPELHHHLHILDGKAADIAHDNRTFDGVQAEENLEEWLLTFENKSFPTMSFPIDEFTRLQISSNGIVRLIHKDPETLEKTVFARYEPLLDINPHIAIRNDFRAALEDHGIIRVRHIHHTPQIAVSGTSMEQMESELKSICFSNTAKPTAKESQQAIDSIRWAFGERASDEGPAPSIIELREDIFTREISEYTAHHRYEPDAYRMNKLEEKAHREAATQIVARFARHIVLPSVRPATMLINIPAPA